MSLANLKSFLNRTLSDQRGVSMIMVLTMVGISGLLMVAGSTIFTALERRTSRDAQRVVEQKIVDEIGLFISSKTSCEVILAPAKNIPAFTNAVTYTDQTTYQDFIDFGAGGSPNPPDILTGLPNGKNFPESASTRLYDGLLVESIKLMNHHVLPSGNRSLTLGVNFRRKGTGGALPVISPYYKLYVFASVDGSGNISECHGGGTEEALEQACFDVGGQFDVQAGYCESCVPTGGSWDTVDGFLLCEPRSSPLFASPVDLSGSPMENCTDQTTCAADALPSPVDADCPTPSTTGGWCFDFPNDPSDCANTATCTPTSPTDSYDPTCLNIQGGTGGFCAADPGDKCGGSGGADGYANDPPSEGMECCYAEVSASGSCVCAVWGGFNASTGFGQHCGTVTSPSPTPGPLTWQSGSGVCIAPAPCAAVPATAGTPCTTEGQVCSNNDHSCDTSSDGTDPCCQILYCGQFTTPGPGPSPGAGSCYVDLRDRPSDASDPYCHCTNGTKTGAAHCAPSSFCCGGSYDSSFRCTGTHPLCVP